MKILAAALLVLLAPSVQAQTAPRNSLYLEHMGNGGILSVNYERDVAPSFSLRAGAGMLPVALDENDADHYLSPVMVNYRVGGGDLRQELGIGVVIDRSVRGDLPAHVRVPGVGVTPTLTLGMRYAPSHSRLLLRGGFTPLTIRGEVLPSYGLSIGFRF